MGYDYFTLMIPVSGYYRKSNEKYEEKKFVFENSYRFFIFAN